MATHTIQQHISPYIRLMRWHQPAGFYLLLAPSLWGLAAAINQYGFDLAPSIMGLILTSVLSGEYNFAPPLPALVLIIIIGALITRSAGCIINDVWDADLDPRVERTKSRPLASKEITHKGALLLFVMLMLVAVYLVLLLNPLVGYLSIAAVVGTIIYPLSKRFIVVPQLVLGLVFGWGCIMSYVAVANQLSALAWLLFAANILWIISYDLQYAICDRKDDISIGIHSGALYFGKATPKVIVGLQLAMLGLLLIAGLIMQAGMVFYIALIGAAGLLVYFYFFTEGYKNESRCLVSFRNNHWFGWLLLAGIIFS